MENLSIKTVAKAWTFESSSGSRTYQTLRYTDGYVSCNCMGWTRREQDDGTRTCTHNRSVDMGTADDESISLKDYSNKAAATPAPAQTVQVTTPKMKPATKKKTKKVKKHLLEDESPAIARKMHW